MAPKHASKTKIPPALQPGRPPLQPRLPKREISSLLGDVIGEAKNHLKAREFAEAAGKCSTVIDDKYSSDEQRKEAYLVRGKALVAAGHLPAAALDFYKALETDHNNSEAYGYILQIQADTGLPLTKK